MFAACMVACGDADAMVTGLTRNSFDVLAGVTQVIDVKPASLIFGLTILLARGAQGFDVSPGGTVEPKPVGMVVNRPTGGAPMKVLVRSRP